MGLGPSLWGRLRRLSGDLLPDFGGQRDLGSEALPFRNAYIDNLVLSGGEVNTGPIQASAFNLSDGSDKNFKLVTTAAGTAYTLTNTSAPLDFGTSDPKGTVTKAGTYLVLARVNLQLAGATFASSRTVTLKLRRTNNTPADLTGGSTSLATGVTSTATGTLFAGLLPPVFYTTTNIDDQITVYADVSVAPSAGALNATEANIVFIRLTNP